MGQGGDCDDGGPDVGREGMVEQDVLGLLDVAGGKYNIHTHIKISNAMKDTHTMSSCRLSAVSVLKRLNIPSLISKPRPPEPLTALFEMCCLLCPNHL